MTLVGQDATLDVLIVDAEVEGRRVDVEWRDGMLVDISPHRPRGRRGRRSPGAVLDAAGGALVPGLHDHHLHLHALAAADRSIPVGPQDVGTADGLAAALAEACVVTRDGWVRAVGYHESVAGELDAERLDSLVPAGRGVSIRVQHRSGQLWMLNRRAVAATRLDAIDHPGVERDALGSPTGRAFGLDDVLADRVPVLQLDLAGTLARLAQYGITGVTDLTPTESSDAVDLLASAALDPRCPVRVVITGGPGLDPEAAPGLRRGPVKLLPPDHTPVDLDRLISGVLAARRLDRNVAIHCVTRAGAAVAAAALGTTGSRPGDRIEHGAVLDDGLLEAFADLGLLVVTQPNFVAERGDQYTRDVERDDLPHLWRCAGLPDHGVAVAGGTDAPYGHPDPWRAVVAAIERRTPAGVVLGEHERIGPAKALALFTGSPAAPAVPRRLVPGATTDLCLLARPLATVLEDPSADAVRATIGRAGIVEVALGPSAPSAGDQR